ncbi:MAG TPA: hypothetical protein VM821_03960, partial [Abditibacteriaceae bacterium]|nr:hypothetical protein [Abditibacteriaceae bacterium]
MPSSSDSPSSSSPSRSFLFAVALISAAVLGFEVTLTRLFSVLLRYHFAFLVICVALCGLGVGGFAAHWWKHKNRAISLPTTAILFALSIALTVAILLQVLFAVVPDQYWIAAPLMLVPFGFAGAFLAEAFARFPGSSGRIYAWDLAGAALAALLVVWLLQVMGAVNASLAMAIVALAGALCAVEYSKGVAFKRVAAISGAGVLLWMVNARLNVLDIPAVPPKTDAAGLSLADRGVTQPLFTELGTPGHTSRIVETRWNAFARTDIVSDSALPDSYYVYTNGNVPTNMMKWDGQNSTIPPIIQSFPLMNWVYANAPLGEKAGSSTRNNKSPLKRQGAVFSIGPGGGLDALAAVHYGAVRFDGAEINPSIVGMMRDYREYNGGIYERPEIHVETADGRAAIREAAREGKRYALVYSALTKTATAGQGMALLESFIYTQDAFNDYWNALDSDGQIAVVTDQAPLVARLFTTTLAMMQTHGINSQAACGHIAIAADHSESGPYRYAFIVSKKPFSSTQTYDLSASTAIGSISGMWIPGRASLDEMGPYSQVASGKMSLDGFINWWRAAPGAPVPIDVSPAPDDRPFVLDLTFGVQPLFWQMAIFALVLGLGLGALSWSFPSANDKQSTNRVLDGAPQIARTGQLACLLYFTLLGVGFMLIEIPLMQKLILPLGYPTLSLTVLLFSLLLGGGLGAWLSQQQSSQSLLRYTAFCSLGVVLFAGALIMLLPVVDDVLLGLPIVTRCIVAGAILFPLGVLLGSPFPGGMRLFSTVFEGRTPLLWGLNGVASVVGSIGAAL